MKKVTRIGWHWNWILGWLFSLQLSSIQLCILLLTGFWDHILIFQAGKQLIRHIFIIISIVVGSSRFWLFTPAQQCIGIFQSASWCQFCASPIRCQNLPQPPAIFFAAQPCGLHYNLSLHCRRQNFFASIWDSKYHAHSPTGYNNLASLQNVPLFLEINKRHIL